MSYPKKILNDYVSGNNKLKNFVVYIDLYIVYSEWKFKEL